MCFSPTIFSIHFTMINGSVWTCPNDGHLKLHKSWATCKPITLACTHYNWATCKSSMLGMLQTVVAHGFMDVKQSLNSISMLVGHRGRCLLTLEVNKQQGGLSDQRLQCMCLWIRCPWGNVTSIVPFDWRLELQWSLKTAFLAILSNNCVFKICSWYQLSNFKVLLGKMTVQNFTQLNPAILKILFLTLWQRTMWAAIFVLDSVLSFPLPQRCSSFIQLKLW